MFEENRALRHATSGRGRWNPWDVSSEFRAREAARAGWFVAAWQAAWGAIGLVFGGALAAVGGGIPAASAGVLLIAGIVYVGIFAGLGWVIRQSQPRWASIVLLILMLLLLLSGLASFNFGVVMNFVLTVLAVLSVRGAFAYAQLRRDASANPSAAARTFD